MEVLHSLRTTSNIPQLKKREDRYVELLLDFYRQAVGRFGNECPPKKKLCAFVSGSRIESLLADP